MELTTQREGSATVLTLAGNFDMAAAPLVTDFFNRYLQSGHVKLVADCSQLNYISSAGLRVLLTAVKEARRQNGDVCLAAIQSEEVTKVLRMSGFSNILKIHPDIATAVASFGIVDS